MVLAILLETIACRKLPLLFFKFQLPRDLSHAWPQSHGSQSTDFSSSLEGLII